MAEKRKLIDLTGAPFIVELREDGKWYIVGVKLRKREFLFESTGLPVELVDRINGQQGNDRIDGLEEMEEFLDGMPEGSKLSESLPSEFATDEDMTDAWEDALRKARADAASTQE